MNQYTVVTRQIALTLVAAFLMVVTAVAQKPRNVIMYIGDGFGIAPKTATRMALGQGRDDSRFSDDKHFRLMEIDNLRYTATLTTHSRNSWITDSAPGATVYAAGKKGKVNNEAIAFNMQANVPVETILEYAKKQGYAVGLVTTTRITHATPADFASHIWNRDLEDIIASQFISASQADYASVYGTSYDSLSKHWVLPLPKRGVEIDVLLGGGARHFLPKTAASTNKNIVDAAGNPIKNAAGNPVSINGSRVDNIDLVEIAKSRGFKYVNSRDALMNLDLSQFTPGSSKKLLGLFNASHCEYEQDRQLNKPWEPNLADMTQIAIEVLKRKGGTKGFFLMVEGGRIDHMEHANVGGIAYAPGTNTMIVVSDKEAPSPDLIYASNNPTATPGIYGSDYLIKEVLSFDNSIGKGRDLLEDPNSETLIFSSSDHECGGLAVVGLHDEADAQNNGTKVRTYAKTPSQTAANGGGTNPAPNGVTPGEAWFPDYTTYSFQGYDYPKPSNPTGPRIVISYGSNPVVNGNGTNLGATAGNHTPQDVWVGSDDNVGGTFSSRITGRGLLDNTDLTPIMKDFLKLSGYSTWDPNVTLTFNNPATFCKNQYLILKLSVKNNDIYPADNVVLNFPAPNGTTFVNATTNAGTFNHLCGSTKCDKWTIPTLGAGQTATLNLLVYTVTTQSLTVDASVLSAVTNPAGAKITGTIAHSGSCGPNGLTNDNSGNTVVYPNPSNSQVNLDFAGKTGTLSIFNMEGVLVHESKVSAYETKTLDIANYPNGLYNAVLISGNEFETVRFVKQ
ncbi:MAG: alkaline phosphatase [Bacteroidota bacterium]